MDSSLFVALVWITGCIEFYNCHVELSHAVREHFLENDKPAGTLEVTVKHKVCTQLTNISFTLIASSNTKKLHLFVPFHVE